MRPASFVLLLAVPVVARSEPDTRIEPAQVSWMEWPAEVMAATTFTVRLVGYGVALSPYGVYPGYVIENPPADTAEYWFGFVRGYIYEPAAPVCGEAKVFHLVTRD